MRALRSREAARLLLRWSGSWTPLGRSAADSYRGVQAALAELANGNADVLAVAKLDRLTRSLPDLCGATFGVSRQAAQQRFGA